MATTWGGDGVRRRWREGRRVQMCQGCEDVGGQRRHGGAAEVRGRGDDDVVQLWYRAARGRGSNGVEQS